MSNEKQYLENCYLNFGCSSTRFFAVFSAHAKEVLLNNGGIDLILQAMRTFSGKKLIQKCCTNVRFLSPSKGRKLWSKLFRCLFQVIRSLLSSGILKNTYFFSFNSVLRKIQLVLRTHFKIPMRYCFYQKSEINLTMLNCYVVPNLRSICFHNNTCNDKICATSLHQNTGMYVANLLEICMKINKIKLIFIFTYANESLISFLM